MVNAVGIKGCWRYTGVLGVLFLSAPISAQSLQQLDLLLGNQKHLSFAQGVHRLALGDESIAGVEVQRTQGPGHPAQLLLTPLKVGSTSLLVWHKGRKEPVTYALQVRAPVEVRQGQVPDLPAMALEQALDKVQLSGNTSVVSARRVQLKSNVVQVDVKVVELNKSLMQQAGLNVFSTAANQHGFSFGLLSAGSSSNPQWGNGGYLNVNAGSPFAQAFGLLMNFGKANIGVNWGILEGHGMARVLAEPSLTALSGQSAHFLAGGEVPVPVGQGNGATSIDYKSYGVGLTVSPTVLEDQRIVLKVAPESSELDYANAVTLQSVSVPAITTRRADTTVELGDGESFVIGGLVSQHTTSTVNRVPLLSQIPILGTLFKRQEFARKDRELVIVVTPRLVHPVAAQVKLDPWLPAADGALHESSFWQQYWGPSRLDAPGFSQ